MSIVPYTSIFIVKLEYIGFYILLFAPKHILWVLVPIINYVSLGYEIFLVFVSLLLFCFFFFFVFLFFLFFFCFFFLFFFFAK